MHYYTSSCITILLPHPTELTTPAVMTTKQQDEQRQQLRDHKKRQRRRQMDAIFEQRRSLAQCILKHIAQVKIEMIDGFCEGETEEEPRIDWSLVPPSLDPLK